MGAQRPQGVALHPGPCALHPPAANQRQINKPQPQRLSPSQNPLSPKQRAAGRQSQRPHGPTPAPAPLSGKREQPRRFTHRILFLWKINPAPASAKAAAGPAPRGCHREGTGPGASGCHGCQPGKPQRLVQRDRGRSGFGDRCSAPLQYLATPLSPAPTALWLQSLHTLGWGQPVPRGQGQPLGPSKPRAQHREARAHLLLAHPPVHKDTRSHRMGTFSDPLQYFPRVAWSRDSVCHLAAPSSVQNTAPSPHPATAGTPALCCKRGAEKAKG